MELHERIKSGEAATAEVGNGRVDPFAEVKTRLHLAIIGELGPQLYNTGGDAEFMRDRVVTSIKERLAQEPGLSRDDRVRLAEEIEADILRYGPVEPLLNDDTVSEVMINGPYDIWLERDGRLSRTPFTFTDESHLRRIINKMVGHVGRRIDDALHQLLHVGDRFVRRRRVTACGNEHSGGDGNEKASEHGLWSRECTTATVEHLTFQTDLFKNTHRFKAGGLCTEAVDEDEVCCVGHGDGAASRHSVGDRPSLVRRGV